MKVMTLFERIKNQLESLPDGKAADINLGNILAVKDEALSLELILWLIDKLPKDATYGDAHTVIDNAKWWLIYQSSNCKRNDVIGKENH